MSRSSPSAVPLAASFHQRHDPESPKAFFRLLHADRGYLHRVLSKWLHQAGFEIRWVMKRANHHVWSLHLLRGTVPRGHETDTAREIICATLRRCGTTCRKKEIEVTTIGSRVGVAFVFQRGNPGALIFSKGRESWSAEDWP